MEATLSIIRKVVKELNENNETDRVFYNKGSAINGLAHKIVYKSKFTGGEWRLAAGKTKKDLLADLAISHAERKIQLLKQEGR